MRLYIIRHGDPDYDHDSLTPRGEARSPSAGCVCAAPSSDAPVFLAVGPRQGYLRPLRRMPGVAGGGIALDTRVDRHLLRSRGHWEMCSLRSFPVRGAFTMRRPRHATTVGNQQKYFDDPRLLPLVCAMEQGSDALLARHGYVREGARYRVIAPSEDRIAIFCHQGIGTTWLSYLLHLPYQAGWAGMWQACTAISEIILEQRSQRWAVPRLLQMGATPHLVLAGLPGLERGLDSLI